MTTVNPWQEPDVVVPEPEWELYAEKDRVNPTTWRLRVPGGYLYKIEKSLTMTFVPGDHVFPIAGR